MLSSKSTPDATKATIQREYGNIVQLTDTYGVDWQRDHICKPIFEPIAAIYPQQSGYLDGANLGLGCGFPVAHAEVKSGETVLDLGCAAGIDSFIARAAVGADGQVIGLDITPELVARATHLAEKQGFNNVRFHCADIENLPLPDASVDVIISNGVFSLLPHRRGVFQEMYRVLRPGGRFCICDLVRKADIPENILEQVLQFTGCLNGIFHVQAYLDDITVAGFPAAVAVSERNVPVPVGEGALYEGLYAVGIVGRKKEGVI